MTSTTIPFECPEGFTCILKIYPAWHDAAMIGLLVGLVLLLVVGAVAFARWKP